MTVIIRRAAPADLPALERIQLACPEAAHWPPAEYLQHDTWVDGDGAAGFVVLRSVAPDEHEILNLAVAPPARRRGLARTLLDHALARITGSVFLEVRASNAGARAFYRSMGFDESGRRKGYYEDPAEDAIVMTKRVGQAATRPPR